LTLRTYAVNKLTDDGTLVQKHLGVDTQYEVFYDIFFTVK